VLDIFKEMLTPGLRLTFLANRTDTRLVISSGPSRRLGRSFKIEYKAQEQRHCSI
jgi:hypothetical protein